MNPSMNPINPLNFNDPAQLAYLEKLKGNIPQVANSQVDTQIMTPYNGQPFKAPVAPVPTPAPVAQTPAPVETQNQNISQKRDVLLQNLANKNPELADKVMDILGYTGNTQERTSYTTPSGAEVSATGEMVKAPLQKYGIGDISSNFDENPFQTLQAITQQITTSLGLPDVRDNLTKIADEMENLANERDDEIRKIEDNPWISGPSKTQLIEKVSDKYEKKLSNRQSKLTILQNAYNTARQEAQYAVNTALTLYDKQRQFNYQMTQDTLDRELKQQEATRKAGEIDYSIQDIGGRKVRYGFDKDGNVVSEVDLGPTEKTPIIPKSTSQDPLIQKLLNTAGGKPLTDTFAQQLNRGLTVLSQIGLLQQNVKDTKTGPIVGLFKGANPWDTDAQTIKAQLNAIVPNLARGVYGEVGVLTDNDIKTYSKTLPTLTSPESVRNAVLGITLDLIGRSIKRNLEVNAANGKDVSGFVDIYTEMQNTKDSIFSQIPGSKIVQAPDGSFIQIID